MFAQYTKGWVVVAAVCLGALVLAGCGGFASGKPTGAATATVAATATHVTYHLDSSIRRNCTWRNNGPATCQVYVTNNPDSNITFEWQGVSNPPGATFTPHSGSIAPGQTSGLITVVAATTICPITFRFVDVQHQLESDTVFNPCNG